MTNDEDSKDMALFERTLKRATRAAVAASKSIWRTIVDKGGKRVEGAGDAAQPNATAIERLAAASVLFHPQPGSRPMHFGGRVLQMQVLQGLVDALAAQGGLLRLPAEAPLPEVQDVALQGARGLGKTALGLRWLKETVPAPSHAHGRGRGAGFGLGCGSCAPERHSVAPRGGTGVPVRLGVDGHPGP